MYPYLISLYLQSNLHIGTAYPTPHSPSAFVDISFIDWRRCSHNISGVRVVFFFQQYMMFISCRESWTLLLSVVPWIFHECLPLDFLLLVFDWLWTLHYGVMCPVHSITCGLSSLRANVASYFCILPWDTKTSKSLRNEQPQPHDCNSANNCSIYHSAQISSLSESPVELLLPSIPEFHAIMVHKIIS